MRYAFIVAVLCAPALAAVDGEALEIEPISETPVLMEGANARVQLLVTRTTESRKIDETRRAKFTCEPAGVVVVDEGGLVTPVADGDAVVRAVVDGVSATAKLSVRGIAAPSPINFKNQVVPIFTKLGCNGGGCHGKSGGQNGFSLSLLGFYPKEDYEFLVKEGRGRRLSPADPAGSLLITKPLGLSPHGGGTRMQRDSSEARVLTQWIRQGMPYGSDSDPTIDSIRCVPSARILSRDTQQQVAVIATYTDGRIEDVTRMALFEANDSEMATVSKTGLASTLSLSGEVAVMARYRGQVATFRATIPLGADVSKMPAGSNFIDRAVFKQLTKLGVPPSSRCDDATFLRRVSIDITGTLPTQTQAVAFLKDKNEDKRARLVDTLLETTAYADYFTNKWNMILRNKRQRDEDLPGLYAFREWIWTSLYENKPYDKFVGEILTATGDSSINPPAAWYREVDRREEQVEDTAQLFLGQRIQCAKCHHHPFEKWSQDDYYGLAAFFARVGKKKVPGSSNQSRERRLFHNEGRASANNPRSGRNMRPTGLGEKQHFEVPDDRDPRRDLADWLARPGNPFFAKALVNRYWKHFFSRGIVEPEDDMRATNPPSNPELLDALAKRFVESRFDLKSLVRDICNSEVYQLSATPNGHNDGDRQNFSRFYPRRLTAEVLFDAFHQVSNAPRNLQGSAADARAIQLSDSSRVPYFLKVFGQPEAETACECERSVDANLAQSLHLLNSADVQTKIANGKGRARTLAADNRSHKEKIEELYLVVLSRRPAENELKTSLAHIEQHKADAKIAYEDLLLVLINTKEFLFNH